MENDKKYYTDEDLENDLSWFSELGVDEAEARVYINHLLSLQKEPKQKQKFARKCSNCGKVFNEGYVVCGGEEYYCSDSCLYNNYGREEWLKMTKEGSDDSYYTEWEDEDDYQYYEDGTEIEE